MTGGLKIGQRFVVTEYESVARIRYADDEGEVLVMHNNSSHILVASTSDTDVVLDRGWAVLEASFPYYLEEGDYAVAYRYALRLATLICTVSRPSVNSTFIG